LGRNITLLSTSILGFLGTFGLFVMSPTLPQYAERYGASYAEIGMFFSAYSLTWALLQMYTGHLCDRFGRKRLGSLGLATFGLSAALCGAAQSFTQLVSFRILQGVGLGFFGPAALGLVAKLEEKSKGFSAYRTFQGVGILAAPIVGGMLGSIGLSYPFFASAAVSVAAIPTLFFIEEKKTSVQGGGFTRSMRELLSNRDVVMVCLAVFLAEVGFAGFDLVIPLVGSSEGLSTIIIGLILSAYFVTFLVFQIPIGGLLGKRRIRHWIPIFALSSVPPYFLLYLSRNPAVMAIWMGWLGISLGALFVQSGTLVAEIAPPGEESLYMAFLDGVIDLSFPVMPVLVTPLLSADLRSPFLLFSLLTTLSAILLFLTGRTPNRSKISKQ
jgi:MFS family permease